MRHRFFLPATFGTACALVASTYVIAQVPKAEEPKPAVPAKPEPVTAVIVRDVMKKVAVPAAPVAKVARVAQAQNVAQQLRPFLRVEYHFIRTVCDLNPDQRREIARVGERALRQAAARNLGRNINGGQVFVVGRGAIPQFDDPLKPIRAALAAAVEENVSPEQVARYKEELKRKEVHWKQTAVRTLVARLDQDLLLTHDQRASISAALLAQWDDSWGLSLQALANIEHYFPPIPDACIVPSLDGPQKQVWESTRPTRRSVRFGVAAGRLDDGIEDEELTEAREAESIQQPEK